jgi:hypothetical protein
MTVGPPFPELRPLWEALIRAGQPYKDHVPFVLEPESSLLDKAESRHARPDNLSSRPVGWSDGRTVHRGHLGGRSR